MQGADSHGRLPGSLGLAYIGDTVYDLYVRKMLLEEGGGRMKQLHGAAVRQVCAHAQAQAYGRVEALLQPDEADVARRARNAHQHPPRNADAGEYHRATALEAVVGYLYLTGRLERLDEIMKIALSDTSTEPQECGK